MEERKAQDQLAPFCLRVFNGVTNRGYGQAPCAENFASCFCVFLVLKLGRRVDKVLALRLGLFIPEGSPAFHERFDFLARLLSNSCLSWVIAMPNAHPFYQFISVVNYLPCFQQTG